MYGFTLPPWRWFMRLVFGVKPWVGGLVIFALTIPAMRTLQWWWDGRAPHLNEYSLGHILGDSLLAVMTFLLARTAETMDIKRSRRYWMSWIALSLAAIIGYNLYKWSQGLLGSPWYLLEPTILYHNVLLFLFIIPAVGGTLVAVVVAGGWLSREMLLGLLLVAVYLALVGWWDPHHPHPEFTADPGSLGDQFKLWVRSRH